MSVFAIIPIGGVGKRINEKIPKQFIEINGKSIAMHTIEKFEKNPSIDHIVIACVDNYLKYMKDECKKNKISKLYKIVPGGETQMLSIYNCIKAIKKEIKAEDKIIIHVGNRPLLSHNLITTCIEKYDEVGMLTTYLPSVEVLINQKNKKIVPRSEIVRIQTPQVFAYKDLLPVMDIISKKNDYCTLCDLMIDQGYNMSFVKGEFKNFKITYHEDLEIYKLILNKTKS